MWLFRPPNGILVAQRGKFWICASRELSGAMLSMNLNCEINLMAIQQSLFSDLHHQLKSRSKKIHRHCNQFGISSLSLKTPVWILLIIILKQSTELRSIQSLCQQICSACPAMIAIRGISCFFMENFIKTSFSWQKLCFHAPVYVSCIPCSRVGILFPKIWM